MAQRRRPSQPPSRPQKPPAGGFTLIEIMAVVLIMGLVMSAIGYNVMWQIEKARAGATRNQIEVVGAALETYRVDSGTFPSTEQGLDALLSRPTLPPEPRSYPEHGYLRRRNAIHDGWGRRLEYRNPGQRGPRTFDLFSLGRDNATGGEDLDADVSYWDSD